MDEATTLATSRPTRLGERRQVSVLSTDMVGYTAIIERLGEEGALAFTRMIYERLSDAVHRHGGVVRGFAGDSIMAVFGIPEVQEDAAIRACRAALSIQAAFGPSAGDIETKFGVRPCVRVGVSSGVAVMAPVEGEGGQLTAVGNTVNLAARIQKQAQPGGCLVCDATRRLVEWLVELNFGGEHEIRGMAKRQKVWQLLSVREGAKRFDASVAQGLSEYVGRSAELAELSDALDRARTQLCAMDIVAEPGLGKTRLVFEFLRQGKSQDAVVLTGHCSANGQRVPFFPFLEVVRSSFLIRDEDEPREIARKLESGLRRSNLKTTENVGLLLNFLGIQPPAGAFDGLDGVLIGLRTRDLLRALLRARCATSLIVVLIEDIHWIDHASEEMLSKLIESGGQPNLLIIHTRRPEYVPDWRDKSGVIPLALGPLAAPDIGYLIQTRLGIDHLPEALILQVTERAAGNPLFGEEILSFLLEQGALRIDAGKVEFDAELGKSALPPNMQSLLAARIDRLEPEDRAVLQAAAAIGRRFDPGLLSSVSGKADETGAALRRLQVQDIVYREAKSSDYIFKHVLLRDTVYQSLLSDRRTELHLAIAKALEKRNDQRLAEAAETLAYHYGLTDRTDLAFTYSALAGVKSLGVFSLGEANRYFASAFALYQHDPACTTQDEFAAFLASYALCLNISLRVKTMLDLAIKVGPILEGVGDSHHRVLFLHHHSACLVWNGRYRDALEVQSELSAMAERLGDPRSMAYALVTELSVSCYCGRLSSEAFTVKRQKAETVLAGLDDAYLHNFFLAHVGWNAVSRGQVAEANQAADNMIVVGVSMNDPRSLGYGTAMKALIAMVSDDHETALAMAEQALSLSRVQFEITIASAARCATLVPLDKPGALDEVKQYVDSCEERGWALFCSTPDTMVGVGLAVSGKIDDGLRHIEMAIARREQEGYQTAADWYRLFLCEVYLEILSGKGGASLGVLLRNIRSLSGVFMFGAKRIFSLVEQVRSNPQFDRDGHHIGRTEMILGLLYKIKKKNVLARRHLTEALRIVKPSGPSPMLTRIEEALAELDRARR